MMIEWICLTSCKHYLNRCIKFIRAGRINVHFKISSQITFFFKLSSQPNSNMKRDSMTLSVTGRTSEGCRDKMNRERERKKEEVSLAVFILVEV